MNQRPSDEAVQRPAVPPSGARRALDLAVRAVRVAYPFMFAVVPVLFVTAKNASQVEIGQVVPPLLYMLAFTALAVAIAARLVGGYARGAVLTCLLLMMFFVGGGLDAALTSERLPLPRPVAIGIEWLLVGVALWAAWRWLRVSAARVESVTTFLAAMATILTLNVLTQMSNPTRWALLAGVHRAPFAMEPRPDVPPLKAESAERPDVYYIVADAYARADALARAYGFDNSEFIRALEARGFYVAPAATSNYAMTFLSLSSTLNLRYHDEIDPGTSGKSALDRLPYYRMMQAPAVAREFQALGYRYVQVLTHWGGTDRTLAADRVYRFVPLHADEFSVALANLTLLRPFTPRLADQHRFTLQKAAGIAKLKGPTFAFVHLLLPHNPYVFDRDGNVIHDRPLTMDFNRQARAWTMREAFLEQLQFTNKALLELIDSIRARSAVPPIILVQGDHGTAHTAVYRTDDPEEDALPEVWERMAVLSAFHVPPAVRARLYPGISNVNTFRLLLAGQYGRELELLPDRNYFSFYDDVAGVTDVTAELLAAAPPPDEPPPPSTR